MSSIGDVALLRDAYAYNWLILGTDAHAKNHSLVLRGQRVQMAPLYDMASLAPHHEHPPKAKLAQKIGGTYVAGRIGERHWIRFAEEAGIDPDETLQRVRELAERVPDVLRETAMGLDLTDDERAAATRLVEAIASWTMRCRTEIGSNSISPAPTQPKPRPTPQQARAPKGTASGGRFLPIERSEPDVEVGDDAD